MSAILAYRRKCFQNEAQHIRFLTFSALEASLSILSNTRLERAMLTGYLRIEPEHLPLQALSGASLYEFEQTGSDSIMDRAGFEPASISLSNFLGFVSSLILIPEFLLLLSSYKFLDYYFSHESIVVSNSTTILNADKIN